MMIQSAGSTYADAYYPLRNFYPYRRDPPSQVAPVDNKPAVAMDIVDLSPQAQALLAKSTKNNNQLIT